MVSRAGFVVAVRAPGAGHPAGLGFVVDDQHVVTCAHVVNAALGLDRLSRQRPPGSARLQIEFPLLGDSDGSPVRTFKVVAWDPPWNGAGGRDTAGLAIVGGDDLPPGAGPARLIELDDDRRPQVSLFGYPGNPSRKEHGAWSTCRLRGLVAGPLMQLDAAAESSIRAQPGYSGTPAVITDEAGDAVIGMLAVAPRDGAAPDAYAVPLSEISAAWPELLDRYRVPPCPYRGLQTFTASDADAGLFVGRENEIGQLRSMVRNQQLVMVVGPSGVGKSSLVEAGLSPLLRDEGWVVVSFRPGSAPLDAVARALLDVERPGDRHSLADLNDCAARVERHGLWQVARQVVLLTGRRIALVGDQFEELLTLAGRKDPAATLELLFPEASTEPASDDVRLICTLRADFLPELLEMPGMGSRLQDRQLNLSPLGAAELARVITEPAAVVGVTYADHLAESIAREASLGRGGLPLLEFTLTELWPAQQQQRLSFEDYHAIGGVAGALNRHAERVYTQLAERFDGARLRRALLMMIRTREGAASAVRAVVRRAALGDDWAIAEALARPSYRLVVLGPDGPGTAEIAHEALIREWARLAAWVDADAEFQRWLAVMEERAAEGDLLSDTRIGEAQSWMTARAEDIPADVALLIAQSRSVVQQRIADLEEARQQADDAARRSHGLSEALVARTAELEKQTLLLASQNSELHAKTLEVEESRFALEERADQLTQASRYKSEFLANMSHELRTPLNSLLILARLLAENHNGNLTPKQVEFADVIHSAGSDLLMLIDDILDLTKVEAGRMEMVPAPFAVEDFVYTLDATFRPIAAQKGLDFSIELDPDLPGALFTDEQRLSQILRNLLANAVKFTSAGAVSLRIFRTEAPATGAHDAQARARSIAFVVTDTGIGIASDKLDIIFEAFRQADGTTTREFGGTGLGLSISRELASLFEGEISAKSAVGKGSEFTLLLPLDSLLGRATAADRGPVAFEPRPVVEAGPLAEKQSPEAQPLSIPHFGGRFSGETVLIVDDDVRNVFALTSVLEDRALTVRYADNGAAGVDLLIELGCVDLLVMDIMMPLLNGYDAMRRIRAMDRFATLPIIALTARAMVGDREKALESGATAYVTKPVGTEDLIDLIHELIDGDSPGSGIS